MGESVLRARKMLWNSPHIGAFYLANRSKENEIGELLREMEDTYFEKLRNTCPGLEEKNIKAMFGLMFGLVFAPNVPDESVLIACKAAAKTIEMPPR